MKSSRDAVSRSLKGIRDARNQISIVYDKIGPERVKIINVYPQDSRIKVYRSFGGSTSIAHTAGDSLIELSRKITFNSGFSTSTEYKLNSEYYFDPRESAIIPSENLILYSLLYCSRKF
jgi:hypothetical protein